MSLRRAISRLRAAHALSFAMAAGQKPDRADLDAAGLGDVSTDLFEARVDGGERPRRERPAPAASDAPPGPKSWDCGPATEVA